MQTANTSRSAPSSPRRVIFVNRYFYPDMSATSQILFDLTRRLVQGGVDVHIVCSRQLYEDPSANLPAVDIVEGIHVRRVWTSSFGRGRLTGRAIDYVSFYLAAAIALLSLARPGDVIVAKTDPPLISVIAAIVARLRRATLINWLQDIFPEVASHLDANPLPKGLDAVLRRVRDASLRTARVNVVLGKRMRDYVAARGIPLDRIRIIENWADGGAIEPLPSHASQLRSSLGLKDQFVVSYSGNLGRAHDFHTMLDAAEKLPADSGITFLMIGGGANMANFRNEVAKRVLTNVQFLPYQSREILSDSLAAADIHLACLLPALEGLIVPSKFYGILAVGRPLIFIGDTDGELARIIKNSRLGAVVRVGDGKALSDCIVKLKASRNEIDEMGVRARQLFIESYTVERGAGQWMELLSEFVHVH